MNIPARNPSIPTINPTELSVIDGQVTTTSLHVAEHFGKPHRDVLTRIRALDCSPAFTQRNFSLCTRKGANNKPEPYYRMTRDGFTFLCMGFTGKRAAAWKEAYINAFNQMEQQLHAAVPAVSDERRYGESDLHDAALDLIHACPALLLRNLRLMVSWGPEGQAQASVVPPDALVVAPRRVASVLSDPFTVGDELLPEILEAASRRLADRARRIARVEELALKDAAERLAERSWLGAGS